jgi:hypothetical protein
LSNFKTYENKTSIKKRYSRLLKGGTVDVFEKKLGWWERKSDIEKNQVDDIVFKITPKYENRPDLVAYDIYNRPDLEWIVLMYNNIIDINEEFITGKTIFLPSVDRVFYNITI